MSTATLAHRPTERLKSNRLESLDGVRGLAALFVAWFHIYQRNEFIRPDGIVGLLMHWTSAYGWLGVPAFFVITGFVIPYSIQANRYPGGGGNASRFLAKRALRLYPPFAVAAALTFAIIVSAPFFPGFRGKPIDVSVGWVVKNFTLTVPFFDEVWANPVFWTLLVELQYYLVVAILFAASPLLETGRRGAAILICVVSCGLSVMAPHELHSVVSWAPPFVVGYLLYQWVVESRELPQLLAVGAIAIGAMLCKGKVVELAAMAITAGVILARWSPGRFVVTLGTISYSLYLIHYPIGVRAVRLFMRLDTAGIEAMSYVASMVVVVLASWVFYLLFEQPSLRLSRSIRYQQKPQPYPGP